MTETPNVEQTPTHTEKCIAHGWDILHDPASTDPAEAKC